MNIDTIITEKRKLWKGLADLVGASTKEELVQMEAAIRITPGVEQDKIAILNAVHVLLETVE